MSGGDSSTHVDQPESFGARWIKPGEFLCDASTHRAACQGRRLPADMIEQFRQVARE